MPVLLIQIIQTVLDESKVLVQIDLLQPIERGQCLGLERQFVLVAVPYQDQADLPRQLPGLNGPAGFR